MINGISVGQYFANKFKNKVTMKRFFALDESSQSS